MERKHIIVLGGGVAGITSAHELIERGFKVTLFEQRSQLGGKARSMSVAHTATPGHHDLPGEHGFRFFPGFYKHVPNTMSRIRYADAGSTDGRISILDNLVNATMFAYACNGEGNAEFPTRMPNTLQELIEYIRRAMSNDLGLTLRELVFFSHKLLILLSSSEGRRFGQWEQIAWWDFIDAANQSPVYQKYLGRGLTRSLVAMKAEISSTRTVGFIFLQLLLSIVRPGETLDRLLNGPTNDVWIDPWVEELREKGVEFQLHTQIQGFNMQNGQVLSVTLEQHGEAFDVTADHYISSVPVEVFQKLITPEMVAAAPSLNAIHTLRTDWMNGIQFYLDRDVTVVRGHVIYIDSPWSLTSVSQHQFWDKISLEQYANGEVHGIFSVDISDWEASGILYKKPARECTRLEIKNEVWAQMIEHIGPKGHNLASAKVLYWHLDPDIVTDSPQTRNLEPLLVNTVDSWSARPDTSLGIPNLNLASDFVRTNTDLATMESANEAARRAVNNVLKVFESNAAPCQLWKPQEPWLFAPLRWFDAVMWRLGMRNIFDWGNASYNNRS